mgnify:CR=1 FL=1|jgi:hypothetical protein
MNNNDRDRLIKNIENVCHTLTNEYNEYKYLRNLLNNNNKHITRQSLNALRRKRDSLFIQVFEDTTMLYYPKWIINESIRHNSYYFR